MQKMENIKRGIPLRGCISTGMATMDAGKSIFFGRPLVEAARGEPAQNCIGVSFGRNFNNYHPAYNRFFIPYMEHMKNNDKRTAYLSPMVLDWPGNIDREGMSGIIDYYGRVKAWYQSNSK